MDQGSVVRCMSGGSTQRRSFDPVQEALLLSLASWWTPRTGCWGPPPRGCMGGKEGLLPQSLQPSCSMIGTSWQFQQRSDTKITFPSLWSTPCCTHPWPRPLRWRRSSSGRGPPPRGGSASSWGGAAQPGRGWGFPVCHGSCTRLRVAAGGRA